MITTFRYMLITQASVRKPESKNAGCFWSQKVGVMVPGIASVDRLSWGRERDVFLFRLLAFLEQRIIQNAVFCEDRFPT